MTRPRGRPNKQLTRISLRLPQLANCYLADVAAEHPTASVSDIVNAGLYWYAQREGAAADVAWGHALADIVLPRVDRPDPHPATQLESRSVRIPTLAHELYAALYMQAQRRLDSPLVRTSLRGLYSLALGEWLASQGIEFEGWNAKPSDGESRC